MTQKTADEMIDAELASLQKLAAECETWRSVAAIACDAANASGLPATNYDYSVEDEPPSYRIHANASGGTGSIAGVLFVINDVRNLRVEVLPVLRELRRRGLAVAEFEDWDEARVRTYRMKFVEGGHVAPLTVRAFIAATSTVCRFEKVGEELKPIMKLVCEGAETPELTGVNEP